MITADLRGKTALVTGGASGIGLATIELLLLCGATVAMNHLADDDRAHREIERFRQHGYHLISAGGDVSRPGEAEKMVAHAVDRLGGLDILVNNAGTSATRSPIEFRDLDAMTEDFWQTILATNLLGPFRCSHAAAPALKKSRGAIVNTASVAGLGKVGSSIAYGASKAGLVNLTRSLAVALAPEVRVNAVAPGFVDSPWTQDWPAERKRGFVDLTLMKRACTPAEIAEAILFLAAGGAMITGHTLPIDGGLI
ncbi:MAG TPA: SDR family oxidoreductase [Stellaceae bacterium]|nr:SDR family oxidoreductase [Stellaceae bacterium]